MLAARTRSCAALSGKPHDKKYWVDGAIGESLASHSPALEFLVHFVGQIRGVPFDVRCLVDIITLDPLVLNSRSMNTFDVYQNTAAKDVTTDEIGLHVATQALVGQEGKADEHANTLAWNLPDSSAAV